MMNENKVISRDHETVFNSGKNNIFSEFCCQSFTSISPAEIRRRALRKNEIK